MKTKWLTGVVGIIAEILYSLLFVLAGLVISFLVIRLGA